MEALLIRFALDYVLAKDLESNRPVTSLEPQMGPLKEGIDAVGAADGGIAKIADGIYSDDSLCQHTAKAQPRHPMNRYLSEPTPRSAIRRVVHGHGRRSGR